MNHNSYPTPEPTPPPTSPIIVPRSIFTLERKFNQYLFDPEVMTDTVPWGYKKIVFPVVVDTEFWHPQWNDPLRDRQSIEVKVRGQTKKLRFDGDYWKRGRFGVTTQLQGIYEPQGMIFAHPDLLPIAEQLGLTLRHQVSIEGFFIIDYLKALGVECRLVWTGKVVKEQYGKPLPVFEFVIYSHFALAEWGMLADREYRQDMINALWRSKGNNIEMLKVLRTVHHTPHMDFDSIDMPWVLWIQGQCFRVKICVKDSSGIHGVASYAAICETCGITTPSKSLMDDYKQNMHLGYFERPEDFDKYALGDLKVYDALSKNAKLFKNVWDSLDVSEYYEAPKLTIGTTVASIFTAKILKEFKVAPYDAESRNDILEKLCFKASASYLKKMTNSTVCLNAKVNGGRCRNNRPSEVKAQGVIVDFDYDGCYGEGLRNQIYPLGNPILDCFDYPSKINNYPTLRQWLKARKWGRKDCELVPGLWQVIVSTKETWKGKDVTYEKLEHPQDFIESWFDFKLSDIENFKTDTEIQSAIEEGMNVKTGQIKIFNHQIINGKITHDLLQIIEHVCSPKQRNELLDKLYVHTAIYYPSYDRVDSPEEVLNRIANHDGRNDSNSGKRKSGGSYRNHRTEECTAWYGVNLGEFLVDDLLAWRKMYPKKTPMNTLYKLVINTLYGDMVSQYFKISNVVVGNNITARARAACWYAEKGLYGYQSITDGTAANINIVVFPIGNRRVTAQSVVNLHREEKPWSRQIKLNPLGGFKKIDLSWFTLTNRSGLPLLKKDGKIAKYPILKLNNDESYIELKPEMVNVDDDKEITVENWTNPAHDWANKAAFDHLRSLFPNVDVLHAKTKKLVTKKGEGRPIKTFEERDGMFQFEVKFYYERGAFHGSANYYLDGEGNSAIAMRSYENKMPDTPIVDDEGEVIYTNAYSEFPPGETFLVGLFDPKNLQRGKVFVKSTILKVKEARSNSVRWKEVGRIAGDTIQKSGLLREFSLSQFTFLDVDQFKSIEREVNFNKRKYCQSYEGFFINEDGTLDFESMVKEIDTALSKGCLSINLLMDKSRHRTRRGHHKHPQSEILEKVRNTLLRPEIAKIEDWFFDDINNLSLVCDENGNMYEVTHTEEFDFSNDMEITDISLLDDIDFGF